MSAESVSLTTLRFIDSWKTQNTHPQRLVAELVSLQKETNREPDNYYFEFNNNLLIDSETGKPVLSFIAPGVERDIAERLQTWTAENEEGLAYWVSPRLENVYPCEKILIHRIAYNLTGNKILLNCAILFDALLENPEKLRQNLFITKDSEETLIKLINWVETVSNQKIKSSSDQTFIKQNAGYYAQQIKEGRPANELIKEMQNTGFLGKSSISCPFVLQSFSNYTTSRASIFTFTTEGKYVKNCGKCGKKIETVIREGYKCDCGGVYEGC
jgi:hypothetical protein